MENQTPQIIIEAPIIGGFFMNTKKHITDEDDMLFNGY